MKAVTIVVPVYADWPSLKDCIESLKIHVASNNKIMLVNDCGPETDALEARIKATIKGLKNYEYYRNPKNLGFVGTCNRAVLELDKGSNDVLLLNSDTKVTAGFLEELTAVLAAAPKHAAVSPRSNNATLATVPLWAAPQKGIDPKRSYAIFEKIKDHLPRYNRVPVAHGFCMLIKRSVIKKYGLFDKAFGKGYGEEVDFCQRVQKQGYKSLLANRAYVFHLEARSFTHAAKVKLIEANNQIIWQRYPDYRQAVREYMSSETAKERRVEESQGIKGPSGRKWAVAARALRRLPRPKNT